MSFAERKVQQFVDRLNDEAVVTRGNGKIEVDSSKIVEIVRSDPKLAELVVKTYCLRGRHGSPELFQLALVVATAYEIEFHDASLVGYVRSAARGQVISLGIREEDDVQVQHDIFPDPASAIRVLRIGDCDPANRNVRDLIRVFHDVEADPENARQLQGIVALEIGRFGDDPRPDFLIPEVRECIRAIDAAFPHFLYYLVPNQKIGQVTIYTNSLFDLQDFNLIPGRWYYNGTLGDVMTILGPRLIAIMEFCERTGTDHWPVLEPLLENFPAEVSDIIRAAREQ
jgi:hypothetical protein